MMPTVWGLKPLARSSDQARQPGTGAHPRSSADRMSGDMQEPRSMTAARCEEGRQRVGGGVSRMPQRGQAKGSFDRLQQRVVGLEARIPDAPHPVVGDGDENYPIVEVGGIVAFGSREQ